MPLPLHMQRGSIIIFCVLYIMVLIRQYLIWIDAISRSHQQQKKKSLVAVTQNLPSLEFVRLRGEGGNKGRFSSSELFLKFERSSALC